MSSPASPPTPTPAPTPDSWEPRRYHWGWRRLRRGKDKKLHFLGQEADEVVIKVLHRHWLFLVKPALPFIAALLGTLLVPLGYSIAPKAGAVWTILELVMVILTFVAGGWFVYRELALWWLDIDIITSKRIINWKGGFTQPSRKETPLEKVQQVAIEQEFAWEILLRYGDLRLYLTGTTITIARIPDPKKVKEIILEATEKLKEKKAPKEKPPKVLDPEMDALLNKLGEQKLIVKLPSADDKYRPLHPDKELRPRRRFGGPLGIVLDIHYTWGEYTVLYIQKSIHILLLKLFVPVLLLLFVLPAALYGSSIRFIPASIMSFWWFIMSAIILGLLITIFLKYINYADDVYLLTNQRIIEIERKFLFLYEERIETEYKNLRDIKVQMRSFVNFLFDVGDVYIETPGSMPDIIFKSVAHPFFIQDKIYEIKGYKEKADETKKENERKEELHLWFGKVIGKLEQSPQINGAPNLQNLDFIEAMERAGELGFKVVVWDEDPSYTDLPPGVVVQQNPPPGTVISSGGEIQVVLTS
jgi:hypothetical protein